MLKLLSEVEDNREIRQGLYPGTGANASTANGGGKPKTDFYWKLALHLFTESESKESKHNTAEVIEEASEFASVWRWSVGCW